MKILDKKISELVFAEYNPRQLSKDQFKQIKDSITRFGIVDPIIVNSNEDRLNIIIGGHQRVKVALEMGIDAVPCHYVNLTRDKERELNIRLNKNTGEWDWQILSEAFDVDELIEWGFSEDELSIPDPPTIEGLTDEDAIPEVVEPITKPGDLWLLGEHRVLCGDATISTDVHRLMDGEKADMVFTDPPYGMDLDADYETMSKRSTKVKGVKYSNVIGDNEDFDPRPFIALFPEAKEQLWWGADYYYERLPSGGSWMVWVKRNEDMTDIIGNHFEVCWSMSKHRRRVIYKAWSGVTARNPEFTREHPTEKPIALNVDLINEASDSGDLIIDLFLGSGSTLIACEKTNRKCYGMELDPHYCDVIVKRWEDFTGKKAELG